MTQCECGAYDLPTCRECGEHTCAAHTEPGSTLTEEREENYPDIGDVPYESTTVLCDACAAEVER